MANYPLQTPVTAIRPVDAVAAEDHVDLVATPSQPVLAPAPGKVLYIGDGTEAPWKGLAPGVVVMLEDNPAGSDQNLTIHVFGFLDPNLLHGLYRIAGGPGTWGYTGADKPQGGLLWLVNEIADTVPRYGMPKIAAGQVVGYVSPLRNRLRWQVLRSRPAGDGESALDESNPYRGLLRTTLLDRILEPMSPLRWLDEEGLPQPSLADASPPPPLPAVSIMDAPAAAPADSDDDDGGGGLLLAAVGGGVVLAAALTKKKRRRR